jgi:hypothetical protein
MSNILRIVVTGPVGAGKSTFIRTISEIEVVDTDCKATDEVAELKKTTTVSMDFGRLRIGEEEEEMWLHLYGTPGQSRFNFMWDILIKRAHGYVLLVPAHLPGQFRNAQAIQSFMKARTSAPYVIGITHVDQPNAWDPEDILLILGNQDGSVPHTTLNAQEPASVANTFAMSAAMLSLGERIGRELGRGVIERVFVQGEKGYGVLTSCGPDAVLLTIASHEVKQGLLFLEIKRVAASIAEAMK